MNYKPDYESVARQVGNIHLSLTEKEMTLLVNACAEAYFVEVQTNEHNADLFKGMWKTLHHKHDAWIREYSIVADKMTREARKKAAKDRALKAAQTRKMIKVETAKTEEEA